MVIEMVRFSELPSCSGKQKNGFTLIELLVVIAILAILSAIAVPRFAGYADKARSAVDTENLVTLNKATGYYAFDKPAINNDIFGDAATDLARMEKLVSSGYLSSAPAPAWQNASYAWDVGSQSWDLGDSTLSMASNLQPQALSIEATVSGSMLTLLQSLNGKTTKEIAAILGSNSISNSTYRAYVLSNSFGGTWPSFPSALQGKVIPDVTGIKIMPFSNSKAPTDLIIYASTKTGGVWNADLFYYEGKGWYRHKNTYNSYTTITFSSMTGTDLKNQIDANPTLWVPVV
jgi:prepilin-type N-terminal cleavage/methylation domain-containing protein